MKKFFKSLILVILIIIFAFLTMKRLFPVNYSEFVDKYSAEYGVDRSLVYAVIKAESGFDANAESEKGAMGLMQLTEETALWCGEKMGLELSTEEIKNPETNIKIGIWYFNYLLNATGSEELAIISYNAGINKVREWINEGTINKDNPDFNAIPYEETQNYIKKVLLYEQIYITLYNMNP